MDKSNIPEGYCQCGCGQKTTISKRNNRNKGWVKGQPVRYCTGHRPPPVDTGSLLEAYLTQEWIYPIGQCQCGCGQLTNVSAQSHSEYGYVKGQPYRYILGHQMAFHVRHPEIGKLPEGYSYCFDCKSFKPIDEMKPDTQRLGKKRYQCIVCALKVLNAYLALHSDHGRRHHLKKKFKLSIEEYEIMFANQKGLCAICGHPETAVWRGKIRRLAVDHCHDTKAIRGLLCMNCNNGLGKFKHEITRLQAAMHYLLRSINDDH